MTFIMTDYELLSNKANDETTARQALPEDAEAVMELLVQTATWLRSTGSAQWSGLLEGNDSHRTSDAVRRGDVFVFEEEGHLAGMVMLLRQPSDWDRELWGEEGHEGAVYVHRLAVSRLFRGKRLGRDIMEWVKNGIRFEGQDRVRLDCIADNPTLNDFYSRLGFAHCGISDAAGSEFCKYELRLPPSRPDLL
ncbi:GNAT family N-acetyltransferase [Cohnella thailandensis]|nr:GNAT family N-acetyltransferase [Cohnella thailandensis]MBP1973189.1 GNAT superfamily N-acetyltransferase [Cohnella thailandensis]